MQIGALIRRAALHHGDAPCLSEGGRTLSFRDFDRLTDKLGHALLAQGLRAGDRVGVLLPNGIDCLIAYYALAKNGMVRVGLNTRETLENQRYKLREVGARGLIHNLDAGLGLEFDIPLPRLLQLIESGDDQPCAIDRSLDAPFRLGFTGGTTGNAKAVTLTTRGELAEMSAFLMDLTPDLRAGETFLHAAPIAHASGAFFLPGLARGVRALVMTKFDPLEFLALAAREQAAHSFVVPTMLAMILEQPAVHDAQLRLRRVCYGASPISPSVLARAEARFGRVFAQTYGQAESPMVITYLAPEDHDRAGSCGRPYSFVEVGIVDDDDHFLPPGGVGEIVCRGPQIMAHYWNRPEATQKAFRKGWLHTGDVGRMDEDGYYYILDRKNDMLISGGFNVYPREVEDVLQAYPGVIESAVVGIPDEKWGDRLHAVIAAREEVNGDEVLAFAKTKLAGYKLPRSIEIWAELPKSGANKILRRVIRDRVVAARNKPLGRGMQVPDMHLVLHGLAIKKHASAQAVAKLVDLSAERVQAALAEALKRGRVAEAQGRYLLTPTARMALDGEYSKHYDGLRKSADFVAAYEGFERINVELKQLITDWQTVDIAGQRVPNDHANPAHDQRIIDRLGALHERADKLFAALSAGLPRLRIYRDQLLSALEQAEDGAIEWVSDARIDSYHTVWFELHEELLRLMGRTRAE
jgi:acyl-CoA synthetase (AMP-forming)/AMP-acid ligase II